MTFIAPNHRKNSFTCPHCQVIAHQSWGTVVHTVFGRNYQSFDKFDLETSHCSHCRIFALWLNKEMMYPDTSSAPMPHEDMPDDCKADYFEARSILSRSPKGAAALLRLTIQKLLPHIGGEGRNIDSDIGKLVAQGLPAQVQQALDTCRVIGNNAVHPGEMNISDSPEIAAQMFELINFIVDNRISQPKRIQAIYSALPQKNLTAIANRDKK